MNQKQFNYPPQVSAFGSGGDGDTGDVWTVKCNGDFWMRDEAVSLKHVDTGIKETLVSTVCHEKGKCIGILTEIKSVKPSTGSIRNAMNRFMHM